MKGRPIGAALFALSVCFRAGGRPPSGPSERSDAVTWDRGALDVGRLTRSRGMVNERQAVRWGIPAWFVGGLRRVTALIGRVGPLRGRRILRWAQWGGQAADFGFWQAAHECLGGQSGRVRRRVVLGWSADVEWEAVLRERQAACGERIVRGQAPLRWVINRVASAVQRETVDRGAFLVLRQVERGAFFVPGEAERGAFLVLGEANGPPVLIRLRSKIGLVGRGWAG